jgi:hypothetical protein
VVDYVTSSTFTDHYIDNQLAGQPILKIALHFNNGYCNGNSAGADDLKICNGSASEQWVSDPQNAYLVNIGRSNDQDNWEVLCNPGGGARLVIGTRDSCSTFHWVTGHQPRVPACLRITRQAGSAAADGPSRIAGVWRVRCRRRGDADR